MTERITNLDDYLKLRAEFRWHCPPTFNFGRDVVDGWAARAGDRTAMHWVGRNSERILTFADVARRSNQVAQTLNHLGLQKGDRIMVILPRVTAWWEAMIGIMKAGMIAVPGTPLLTAGDIAYRAKSSKAACIFTDAVVAEKIAAGAEEMPGLTHRIIVDAEPYDDWKSYEELVAGADDQPPQTTTTGEDPALLYFTSGTTGMPKMVLHTHASYGIGHQITGRYWLDLREKDLHWNISDTGWAKAAWSSLFGPWICGTGIFVHHAPGKFNPRSVFKNLARYPITTMCAAPTVYRVLVQHDLTAFQPAALRHCVAAGEPLNPEVIKKWRAATGLTIRDGYGQTESVLLCANFPGVAVKPGSMGLPSPGIDLAVVDDDGHPVPPGIEGNIAVRTAPERPLGLFREYWQNPAATAAAYKQSWYLTGDRATRDEDGYFWFVGRADEVITSSAYRIGPFEVESALIEHPAVVEAAVVGVPDERRGQIVKAYVVLADGYTASHALKGDLQEHVKRITAPYKYPREIEFVADLPKTVSGKTRRVELRQRNETGAS